MFIKYSKPNLHTLATHDGKQTHSLMPGWNEFPTHIWKENEKHPEILRMIADGVLEVYEEDVRLKQGKKTVTVKKPIAQDDREVDLKAFEEKKAIAIVKDTYNKGLLQRWMDEDTRSKVKRAIEAQVKAIDEKAGTGKKTA